MERGLSVADVFFFCYAFEIARLFIPMIVKQHFTRELQMKGIFCLQFFTSRRKIEVLPSLIIRILTKKTLVQNLFFRLFTVETNLPWTNFKSKYFPRENSR